MHRGGGAPANSPSSPPNCRSVTFPSEQRGYLRGAGAHFSGKGTEVILVWISSLFSGLKHKVGGKKGEREKLAQAGSAPSICYLLTNNTPIAISSNSYPHKRTHTHTPLPLATRRHKSEHGKWFNASFITHNHVRDLSNMSSKSVTYWSTSLSLFCFTAQYCVLRSFRKGSRTHENKGYSKMFLMPLVFVSS